MLLFAGRPRNRNEQSGRAEVVPRRKALLSAPWTTYPDATGLRGFTRLVHLPVSASLREYQYSINFLDKQPRLR